MSQDQLSRAKELINARKYSQAIVILEGMGDHPTAQKWLQQIKSRPQEISAITPSQVDKQPKFPSLFPLYLLNLVIIGLFALLFVGALPIKVIIDEPVTLAVSSEDEEDNTAPINVEGIVGITNQVQGWEYLTVQYSQLDLFLDEGLIEVVQSNDPLYDQQLFSELICKDILSEENKQCAENFRGMAYYLNLWGQEGWELLSVVDKSDQYTFSVEIILKRPKQ